MCKERQGMTLTCCYPNLLQFGLPNAICHPCIILINHTKENTWHERKLRYSHFDEKNVYQDSIRMIARNLFKTSQLQMQLFFLNPHWYIRISQISCFLFFLCNWIMSSNQSDWGTQKKNDKIFLSSSTTTFSIFLVSLLFFISVQCIKKKTNSPLFILSTLDRISSWDWQKARD